MALPVTISADVANQNSYHGPFKSSGGNFYTIVVGDTTATDGDVEAHKATDPTVSFAEQDGANRPTAGASGTEIVSLWTYQVSDLIHVVYQDVDHDVWYARFDMSSDAWVDLGASDFDILIDTTGATQAADAVSIAVRSDGDIVVTYQGDSEMVMGSEFERVVWNVSSDGGVNWDGPVSIDNGGSVDWTGCVIVPGSSDRMHVFFTAKTGNDGFQRTIRADDSLETFPSAFDTTLTIVGNAKFGPGVSYDDAGTQRVRCPYVNISQQISIAKLDSADTPTVTTDDDVSDADVQSLLVKEPAVALAVDVKNLQLLYVPTTSSVSVPQPASSLFWSRYRSRFVIWT